MKVIGIDIGTTSICGVALDAASGQVLRSITENSEAFISTPNQWEKIQDVERIVSLAFRILGSLINEFEGDIAAIGLTGQMHGIVYLNSQGKAVSPLYTWQDARGNLPYKDTTYAKYLGSYSGYGNVTDFYNRENGLVPEGAVTYCTVHDYVAMLLCGNTAPVLHTSDAASLGLFDLTSCSFCCDYHPAVTANFEIIGKYNGIPVAVAIGDNQASVFSTLANEDELLINIGTGSQISIVSNRQITGDNVECRPYFDEKYLIVGSALCGGRAYSLLKDFYKSVLNYADVTEKDVYSIMDRMLSEKSTTSLSVDTRFDGTRSNSDITGSITGITVNNLTPPDLTFGVLCGMIDELYGMYLTMGEKRCGIVASGNGIRKNKALARIASRIFSAPLRIPAHLEEAACGAAFFALVSISGSKDTSIIRNLIKYTEEQL